MKPVYQLAIKYKVEDVAVFLMVPFKVLSHKAFGSGLHLALGMHL